MVFGHVKRMRLSVNRLSYRDAAEMAKQVRRDYSAAIVLIDLENISEATTAGFARLAEQRYQ